MQELVPSRDAGVECGRQDQAGQGEGYDRAAVLDVCDQPPPLRGDERRQRLIGGHHVTGFPGRGMERSLGSRLRNSEGHDVTGNPREGQPDPVVEMVLGVAPVWTGQTA